MAETVLYKKAENFRLSITLERPHVASLPTPELLYRNKFDCQWERIYQVPF